MATNFPGSVDNFSNPSGTDSLNSPSHSLQHADINDAVEALETKIGIGDSPAGSATAGQVLTAQGGGTAIWASGGGGLSHLKTETFSAVASVSVDNVFSSTYQNYLVTWSITPSTTLNMSVRLKTGSDDAGSVYTYAQSGSYTTGVAISGGAVSQTSFAFFQSTTGIRNQATMYFYEPNIAANTYFTGQGWQENATNKFISNFGGQIGTSTQYTGLSVIASTGNITGIIRVYGVQN